MKKIASMLSIALGLAFAAGAAACSGGPAPVKAGDTLVVGITLYEPMNFYDENRKLVGFDTEFAEKALGELGYGVKFQVIDWDYRINELKSGKIDLIWNGMTITEELKKSIAVSDAYLENRQVVVTKRENADKYTDIASLAAADGIAVESGSAGETVVLGSGYGEKLNKMTAQSDCLTEVSAGTSEIAVIDITMARAMTGEGTDFAGLTYVDVGFAAEEYGIGMRTADTALLAELNGIIAKYRADGTFDELYGKYMA